MNMDRIELNREKKGINLILTNDVINEFDTTKENCFLKKFFASTFLE